MAVGGGSTVLLKRLRREQPPFYYCVTRSGLELDYHNMGFYTDSGARTIIFMSLWLLLLKLEKKFHQDSL